MTSPGVSRPGTVNTWGLSRALRDGQQHPWALPLYAPLPLSPSCDNQDCLQTLLNVP